ncbi:ABC transporter permease subunit [Paenibacillus odorifer]|uniref:ABC transporter permease subunit n=1 Tax=Paenibacillus TaxID=44249 RepID=UPI0009D67171|nr:ABC transporter permease subunit [Paenibacillus odorifer]
MNLDWEFIYESLPLYGGAMWLTVKLALLAIVFSLLIGLLFSIVLYYKVKIVSDVIKIYIELSRNTPLLVQLFFLYYGFGKEQFIHQAYKETLNEIYGEGYTDELVVEGGKIQ